MPVWFLSEQIVFPHPLSTFDDGILAVGGDLSVDRLILAYAHGIFPWYAEGDPIIWWFPDPRCVMKPDEIVISKSMRLLLNKEIFNVTFDTCFSDVINRCRTIPRRDEPGTWIQPEMVEAYIALHDAGYAHSIEIWKDDELVGGLYGVAYGKVFFGESMFSALPNASKIALIKLGEHLVSKRFWLIDCQQDTPHIRRMGASLISAIDFHQILRKNRLIGPKAGKWIV
jgi:leucyl/phenylalanyl-tRNA---protein transferase